MGKSPGLTLQASIVQDNVPVEIAPRVFVGSVHAAFNVDVLKEKRISHIVNLAGNYATFPEDFAYLSLSIRDKEYANLLSCLPVALLFLDAALAENNSDEEEERGVLIHCAGGRSRSPAVAIAYLMTKYHLAYEEALKRIRTVRPVVSLNAGFDSQLRFLEKTKGDIFAAHQFMLQDKLTAIVHERDEGMLGMGQSHKKHNGRHASTTRHHDNVPKTPTSLGDSSHEGRRIHAAALVACDDRGMIHGTVPSGFSLSLPEHVSPAAKGLHFIPALRSMGALFGCRSCGENLFGASALIDHCQSTDRRLPVEPICTRNTSLSKGSDGKTKHPLLAKLRLGPHSPSVGRGSPENTTTGGTSKSNPTTPRLAILKSAKKPHEKVSYFPTSPQLRQQLHLQQSQQQSQSPHELAKSGSTSDLTTIVRTDKDLTRTNSGGFWRSLTTFKASTKRAVVNESEDDKKKQKAALSPKAIAIDLSSAEHDTVDDATFLRENAQQWQRKLTQLELSWAGSAPTKKKSPMTTAKTLSSQLSALVARDARAMALLEAPDQLCVAPLPWLLRTDLQDAKGAITCPNPQCGAPLGQWQWEGTACPCGCGHVVLPAFALDKQALRKLGLVVNPPVVPGDSSVYSGEGEGPSSSVGGITSEPLAQRRK